MKILKWVVAVLFFCMPMTMAASEDELAGILEKCLLREYNSPDSIEYNLQLLEKERESKTGVRRAVYTASLAQLYAMRAYSDATGEWSKRSVQLFREALADPMLLYKAPTRDWLPVVSRGKDESIYGANMLYVVWRAAYEWAGDSIMTEQELVDFYAKEGNSKPATVREELQRLTAKNDTIWKYAPRLRLVMADVYYPGDSLRLDIDSFNVSSMEWCVKNNRGKVVSRNPLTAPTSPGRYTLELTCKTDVRLRKQPRKTSASFVVSRLQTIITDMPGKQMRVTVVDARTGKPCKEAEVTINKEERTVKAVLGADSCLPEIRYYGHYNYNAPSAKVQPRVAVYTDRTVYRPGQKIMVSAILYDVRHWEAKVREAGECRVELSDKDGNVVADTTVVSDDFGTLSACLHIPESIDLGNCAVSVNGTKRYVRVEEYRRPTFHVDLDKGNVEDGVIPFAVSMPQTGDTTLTVTGRAMCYDGTPLRSARVTAMARRMFCWWWRGCNREANILTLDTLYTDMEGRFAISVPVSRKETLRYAPMLMLEVSVLSAQGETHTASTSVRLFDDPPLENSNTQKTKDWLECPVDSFDASVPALLEFRGSEERERYVILTAFAGDAVMMDTVLVLQDSLYRMEIPWKEKYADGLRLLAAYVQDGIVHSKNIVLRKRLPDDRLQLHWDTFRDHTQPGANEQWVLRVLDAKGQPVQASVLLGMYDASLDAFGVNRWVLLPDRYHSIPYSMMRYGNGYNPKSSAYWQQFDVWTHKIRSYDFSHFNMKYFQNGRKVLRDALYIRGTAVYASGRSYMNASPTKLMDKAVTAESTGAVVEDEEVDDALEQVETRSDFNETAMFMPQLRTGEDGTVNIAFTIPQSLTTWKVNAIAHTRDMQCGSLESSVVARKALTAKIHLPRFVREKDRMTFTVAVSNTGDTVQRGKMMVQVTDAVTGRELMKKKVSFHVEEERDTVFSFQCFVEEGLKGLCVKAVAKAAEDSDGEQREIPVLASVVNLVNGKAVTLHPGESAKVSVRELFPEGAVDKKLIVERVLDAGQVALSALSEVSVPEAEDVLSRASAYYAACHLGKADSSIYINKVYCMQKEDGSLPWYDGLAGSSYMTREVGFLLARLASQDATAVKVLSGVKRALLTDVQTRLERAAKEDRTYYPDLSDLRTLYVLTKGGCPDKETLKVVKKVMKALPDSPKGVDAEYLALAMIVGKAIGESPVKGGKEELRGLLTHKDGTYLAYRGGAWPSIDRRLHIHTQVMEAWKEVCPEDTFILDGMRQWLLEQKRTQGWRSPIDCIDAVYALTGVKVDVTLLQKPLAQRDTIDIQKNRTVTITNEGDGTMWAGVYASYALPVEKVEKTGMDISLTRDFSVRTMAVGDRIKERVIVDAARDYDYVKLSIPRAGCTELVYTLSGCGWQNGVSYYRQVRDNETEYFFPALPHGKYVIETEMTVERDGRYATGIPTIKCCYAEEFRGHGENAVLKIE